MSRERRKIALLMTATLALLVGVLEIVVRAYQESLIVRQIDELGIHMGQVEAETWQPWREDGEGHFHVRSPNRRLVYENRPNARVSVRRNERQIILQTNSSGFRGEEFATPKPPGVFRIAAVGDSVTIGLFFEPDEVYPKIAEMRLNRSAPGGCRFEVLNMGTTGHNVEQEVELIKTRVGGFDPDLVLIGYVFNDDELGQDAGLWAHFSRTRWRSFDFAKLRWLALRERLRSTTLTERSFAELAPWAKSRGLPVLVVIFPLLDRQGGEYAHEDLHARVRGLAEAQGFLVLDLLRPFAATDVLDKDDGDVIHPSALGHRVAGREVADFVRARPALRCASPT